MTITDCWLNPVTGSFSVLGYSEAADEFPHELISFIQSSIVDADRKEVGLLIRFMQSLQIEWESIYGKILGLPDMFSPEYTPAWILEYLRYNVAISDNLNYIWGTLDEAGKRRFAKYFIQFLIHRCATYGIRDIFETMTGRPIELYNYFYYQWIVSGDGEYAMEMALGEEEDGYDPWLISEYHEAFGVTPDAVAVVVFGTGYRYRFIIDTAVATFLLSEPYVPDLIRVSYKPSLDSIVGHVVSAGGHYYVYGPPEYFFEQLAPYSTDVNDFRVGFEVDQYIYDICVMDEGSLSHEMCRALAKFGRATHERIYIRYYLLIEPFDEDNGEWTMSTGATIDTDEGILILT